MTDELIDTHSPAPELPAARTRLEAAVVAAEAHADLHGYEPDLYRELAATGDHDEARAWIHDLDLDIRDAAEVLDHLDAINRAWHALLQAERRALRIAKSNP